MRLILILAAVLLSGCKREYKATVQDPDLWVACWQEKENGSLNCTGPHSFQIAIDLAVLMNTDKPELPAIVKKYERRRLEVR